MPYVDQKHVPAGKLALDGSKPTAKELVKMPKPVKIPQPEAARK